jgi:hypothetical protein
MLQVSGLYLPFFSGPPFDIDTYTHENHTPEIYQATNQH